MDNYDIPFNRPCFAGKELVHIAAAIQRGHISGAGPFTQRCEEFLQSELGVARALMTTSCTHALEMAALLLDPQPGDEVVVPSFTFVSTANAFALHGARPVFADIRPDTLNLDESRLEKSITERTRAVVPVHYGGVGCEMDAILATAASHGAVVVEDNAHGLFATCKGKPLGSFGQMATLSFHETKNFICGEGGALLVNDEKLIRRAEILREKGTNRSEFFRGEVDKYTWVDTGSSYVMSDLLAAFLWAQFEGRERIIRDRRRIWRRYCQELEDWASANGVQLPHIPGHCDPPPHMFYVLMPGPESRQRLIAHLRERGILAVFHYIPLHLSPMGQRFGGKPGDCPVAEDVSGRLLRLPLYNELSESEQARVIEAVQAFEAF
jgi:dTDP-4-amino-4,6-dideoxygalactose transaminase